MDPLKRLPVLSRTRAARSLPLGVAVPQALSLLDGHTRRRVAFPMVAALVGSLSASFVAGADDPILLGRWPGYRRGPAHAVAVSGKQAFVLGHGFGAHVVDVSRPEKPTHVGEYTGGHTYWDLAADGPYAYLISGSSLEVLDCSNPASPDLLGSLGVHGLGITVSGTRAYVSGGLSTSYVSPGEGFSIVDISDRKQPKLLGRFTATAEGPPRLAASGNLVYLAGRHWEDRQPPWRYVLQVIDTDNPLAPERIGSLELNRTSTEYGMGAWGLVVSGHAAYVAGPDSVVGPEAPGWALRAIDISNPRQPTETARIPLSNKSGQLSIVALGPHLYVGDTECGLEIIDISSSAEPRILGLGAPDTCGRGIAVTDDHAYLASAADGLRVVDIQDRHSPRRVGRCLTDGISVALTVQDEHAYLVEESPFRLRVLDVSHPALPTLVGEWESGWGDDVDLSRVGLAASSGFVYVAASGSDSAGTNRSGVQVIDVGDPGRLRYDGGWSPEDLAWQVCDIHVEGRVAYVLSERSSPQPLAEGVALDVLDFRDGRNPKQLARLRMGGGAWSSRAKLTVVGSTAYVASTHLHILDVSDPEAPRELSRHPGPPGGGKMSLAVLGKYAYVGSIGESCCGGLRVLDVRDAVHPVQVMESAEVGITGLALWGRYLYACGSGFQNGATAVFDLLDPRKPQATSSKFEVGWGGAQAAGDRLYAHDDVEGLLIFGIPPRPGFVGKATLPDGAVTFSWNRPGMGMALQRSATLAKPHWVDAPGSTMTNRMTVSRTEATGFFRLAAP